MVVGGWEPGDRKGEAGLMLTLPSPGQARPKGDDSLDTREVGMAYQGEAWETRGCSSQRLGSKRALLPLWGTSRESGLLGICTNDQEGTA